jgi:lipoprotein LprG
VRTRYLVPALIIVALVLTGCSGSSGDKADPAELAAQLATAKHKLDTAETINISLATNRLPSGVTGLLSAKGVGNHTPAFKGKVVVNSGGTSLGAKVVALDGKVYAKTSFAPVYLTIDPASLKAPDPASLLSADDGITQILVKTTKLSAGGKSRDGSDVLTTIKGSLPGSVVRTIIPSADADKTFTVTYRLDDKDALRDATLAGKFYPDGGNVTYTVKLTTSDAPVSIAKP